MSVEFIGMIGTQHYSEIYPPRPPAIDIEYVRRFTQAHEQADFDRILIGYFSNAADGFIVASYAAFVTQRLGLMLAHRPGFVAPTLAARKLATLDHFSGGRLAVHIISGGDDADQAKDGDFLPHDERYARTDEYVEILRRIWTAEKPIDHEGKYYKFVRSFSDVKPVQKPHLPIYFGGSSDAAIAIAGKHADVYALWGEPLAEAAKTIAQVRASAARHGRSVRFSLSTRPILAATEEAAWARAKSIIEAGAGNPRPWDARGADEDATGSRFAAAARSRRAWRGARHAALDRGGGGDRRAGQHDGIGGDAGAGGRVDARILRAWGYHIPHSRIRSAGRCDRLRAGADSHSAERDRGSRSEIE